MRRALADAIGVLLAARPEPSLLAEAGLPVLTLSGLDRQAAGELVRGQDGLPLKAQLVDRLPAVGHRDDDVAGGGEKRVEQIEDVEVISETIEEVSCRWCGTGQNVVELGAVEPSNGEG